MKKYLILIFLIIVSALPLMSNGVCIVDATTGKYLRLDFSSINVKAENQIAIINVSQTFTNTTLDTLKFSYAYPMPSDGNAISLEWLIDNELHAAKVSGNPPDTTLPGTGGGGSILQALADYLGQSPMIFAIPQLILPGEQIAISLTYVQFLNYELGTVKFTCPNKYTAIQDGIIVRQEFHFNLKSQRHIDGIDLTSEEAEVIANDGNIAVLDYVVYEAKAEKDFELSYTLNSNELGLFGFSTYQETVPDEYSRGFFMFVAEPDQSGNTQTIKKVFTLILDKSGSMSGNKIIQARDAASFIVNNLNDGDMFNIVAFNDKQFPFQPSHVPFNQINQQDALQFINTCNADGSTDIGGAFNVALSQFQPPSDEIVNIILFFTDGQPTAGLTNTNELTNYIKGLNLEQNVTIFPFGIGTDVDKKLLQQIALDNNGIVDFLDNSELLTKITKFYMKIRNPVLLNSKLDFEPNVVEEVYPTMVPNLYKGQQMMISGRYKEPVNLKIKLSGEAFGKQLEYNYELPLAFEPAESYSFLPKIWAKMKVEDLMIQYYLLPSNSHAADSLKELIKKISVDYAIVTKFTSFTEYNGGGNNNGGGGTDSGKTTNTELLKISSKIQIEPAPNPVVNKCHITIKMDEKFFGTYFIKIFNESGNLIKVLPVILNGENVYTIDWDMLDINGQKVSGGVYIGMMEIENHIFSFKIVKL